VYKTVWTVLLLWFAPLPYAIFPDPLFFALDSVVPLLFNSTIPKPFQHQQPHEIRGTWWPATPIAVCPQPLSSPPSSRAHLSLTPLTSSVGKNVETSPHRHFTMCRVIVRSLAIPDPTDLPQTSLLCWNLDPFPPVLSPSSVRPRSFIRELSFGSFFSAVAVHPLSPLFLKPNPSVRCTTLFFSAFLMSPSSGIP